MDVFMPKSTTALVATATFLVLVAAQTSMAQVNTFTSGGPPLGDGNDYPSSLNRSSQSSSGGATVDAFFSDLVGYTNSNFNPAFFDSNNLLTRPAALINGDAFWTDPKIGNFTGPSGGTFPLAQIGFQFDHAAFNTFGFDIAVASASEAVPATLPFQIQDFDSDTFGNGQLVLDPDAGGGFGDLYPSDSGSFFTLGGRQGLEARYRIDKFEIEDLTGEPLSGGTWFLDIDLLGVATLGGTTQVAIDNFVFDGASLPQPTREPVYLPPTPPIGPNRPQYFNYAQTTDDQSDGDSYDFTASDLGDDLTSVTATGEVPQDIGADAFTHSSTIYFQSNSPDNGLYSHEVTHELAPPPGDDGIGPSVELENRVENSSGGVESGDAPSLQILDVQTLLNAGDQRTLDTAGQQLESPQDVQPLDAAQDSPDGLLGLVNIGNPVGASTVASESPVSLLGSTIAFGTFAAEPMFYVNYTVDDYLALKESLSEDLLEGDSGSVVSPVLDLNGEVATYLVSTWTVTTQGGVFLPVQFGGTEVPEPSTGLLLLAMSGGAFVLRRRRA